MCYTDNERMYSNVDAAPFCDNFLCGTDGLIVKKAPRTANVAALETQCTDELFEAVS